MTNRLLPWLLAGSMWVLGCDGSSADGTDKPTDSSADADADADADSDSDADADADTDSDTDEDTDTSPGADFDCEEDYATPEPGGLGLPECVTEELLCGDVIYGTNEGGSTFYDKDFYMDYQCISWAFSEPSDVFDGPERVYTLTVPPNKYVELTVNSCEDVDLHVIRHATTCSTVTDGSPCTNSEGGFTEQYIKQYLLGEDEGRNYEIIIDSIDGSISNYWFEIVCQDAN